MKELSANRRADREPHAIVLLVYNEGEGGVDIVDKMIDTYRSKVTTLRWTLVVYRPLHHIGCGRLERL